MKDPFVSDGYAVVQSVFRAEELETFRVEADRVARMEGSVCVRRLRDKSSLFDRLAGSEPVCRLLPDGLVPVRSILFDKTPEENWPVARHQDLTIAVAEKREALGYGPWSRKDGSVHVQPSEDLLRWYESAKAAGI